MPRHTGDGWVPLSDPSGTPAATARRDVALESTDELYRAFGGAPALLRALDFNNMPQWQRGLMRPNWGALSNSFFGLACVCFLVSSWPPLGDAESVLGTQISGARLQGATNLTGCLLFVIEPVFDFLAVWVECWDDILWTAKEEQENPSWPDWSASSAIEAPPSRHSSSWSEFGQESLQAASTSGQSTTTGRSGGKVSGIMVRKWHFWGTVLFEIGSLCYCWWALASYLYPEEDQCFDCRKEIWHGDILFQCINETGAVKNGPPGFCNASYFGALAFLLNAAFSLIGWRAYRYEVTEMIGFERNLLPPQCSRNRSGNNGSSDTATLCCRRRRRCCRNCKGCCCCECAAVDWLGLAAIIFLAGAAADLVDEFITDPSAQAWVGFAAAVCWTVDAILYAVDQHQMDAFSEPRELPTVTAAGPNAFPEVEWVVDRDETTGNTSVRRSKAIWMAEYNAGKERERMHRTANW